MTLRVLSLRMIAMKVCCVCDIEKPDTAEHFYLRGKRFVSRCKLCARATFKARHLANPEKHRADAKAWRLANPDKTRATAKAYREANPEKSQARSKAWRLANLDKERDAHKAQYLANKDKVKAAAKAWQLANPEKKRAIQKAWELANKDKKRATTKAWELANPDKKIAIAKAYREANPEKQRVHKANRKARTRNAPGSHTAADIARLFAEQSERCGYCAVSIANDYHVDHVIPLSRGGGNDPSNLCLACPRCNLSKGAKLLSELRT